MSFDPKQLDKFASQPGVYIMKDAAGAVLYVGKAKLIKSRLNNTFLRAAMKGLWFPF
jgi:excinuclease ABC subunit C